MYNIIMEKDKILEIKEIIEKNPKNFSQIIQYNQDLKNFVLENLNPIFDNEFYSFATKLYTVIHNIQQYPKCETCGKELIRNISGIQFGFRKYCDSKCANRNSNVRNKIENTLIAKYGSKSYNNQEKHEQTCLEKYGSKTYNNRQWAKNTCLEKYGCEFPMQNKEIFQKKTQTNLEKYGCENPMHNKEITDKRKQFFLEKYGVENMFQSKEIQEKARKTFFEKYGSEVIFELPEIKSKIRKTKLERYGSETYVNLEKAKQTNLERYGVEYTSQNRDIRLKQQTRYMYNNIHFDSSPEIALYIYLKDNHIDFEYQPDVSFEYLNEDSNIHYYFPDFRIEDKFYEIKGDQFFDENNKMINPYDRSQDILYESKQKCMIDNNIIILRSKDYQKYLDYISEKYGKNYLKQFKNK